MPEDEAVIFTGDLAKDTQWRGITPHGRDYRMKVRPGTSDWNTVNACAGLNDEYRIPEGLSGWALDIGAHIGGCTIPLLLDNPDLRVQAVEAIDENARLLAANAKAAGVDDRLEVYVAAAADASGQWATIALPDEEQHHWIGNQTHTSGVMRHVPTIDIRTLMERKMIHDRDAGQDYVTLAIPRYVWAKIDCEGCEYQVFLDPVANAFLDRIVGEVHGDHAMLVAMLEPTHIVDLDASVAPAHFTATARPRAGVH